MQNLDSVAQKMDELLHKVKYGICSSINGWVITLGIKENISGAGGGRGALYLQLIIQSKICFSKRQHLKNQVLYGLYS